MDERLKEGSTRNLRETLYLICTTRGDVFRAAVSSCWFRQFYAMRLPERPSSWWGNETGRGRAVRKIVTTKDFEFLPRKESAAKPEPSCMCMHYACTAALREKCLGSRKARRSSCLVFSSLSLFPCIPSVTRPYYKRRGCVRVSITGVQMCGNFDLSLSLDQPR